MAAVSSSSTTSFSESLLTTRRVDGLGVEELAAEDRGDGLLGSYPGLLARRLVRWSKDGRGALDKKPWLGEERERSGLDLELVPRTKL